LDHHLKVKDPGDDVMYGTSEHQAQESSYEAAKDLFAEENLEEVGRENLSYLHNEACSVLDCQMES
jgi:hypothetical protein